MLRGRAAAVSSVWPPGPFGGHGSGRGGRCAGPPGGQVVYKTPQGGSDMKRVTPGGPGKPSADQPRAGHYPLEM